MNGMQMNSGPQPNYYNNSNLQNNPFNRPQQLYQPQPIYPPPPAPLIQPNPMNMQPNPMNVQPNTYNMQQKAVNNRTAQSTTIQHIVNNSGYSPCPYCHRTVPTTPRRVIGQAQIFWCFILFLFLPIVCCIPFCMQSCEDVHYECSSCLSDNSAHSLIFYRALFTSLSLQQNHILVFFETSILIQGILVSRQKFHILVQLDIFVKMHQTIDNSIIYLLFQVDHRKLLLYLFNRNINDCSRKVTFFTLNIKFDISLKLKSAWNLFSSWPGYKYRTFIYRKIS